MKLKGEHLICIARLVLKQEHLEEAKTIFSDLMKKSTKESGCVRYELHQNMENPLEFTFIDRFENEKAFDFHCAQEYAVHYFDEVLPPLCDEFEISIHREVEL